MTEHDDPTLRAARDPYAVPAVVKRGQRRTPPAVRFWRRVDKTERCWLWTGSLLRSGYAHFSLDGKANLAHRVAYEWLVGPIPEGMQLDHLCRVRRCVNPAHLEPVTNRENSIRGVLARVTECPRGHPYDEQNTYTDPRGRRHCRICRRAKARRDYKPRPSKPPRTHCRHGHELTDENTYVNEGRIRCLTCRRAAVQRNNRKRRAA